MAYTNTQIIENRINQLSKALQNLGIKPGKTLQNVINGFTTYEALNQRMSTTGAQNLTDDIVQLIREGNTDKALTALQDESILHGALLELVWNTQRREAVSDALATDAQAQAATIAEEELPKLTKKFQQQIVNPMTKAAGKLPFNLDPATILADDDLVTLWRGVEEAKAAYPQYLEALKALSTNGGYADKRGHNIAQLHHSFTATFETPEDYQAATQAGDSWPWAAINHGGTLGINNREEVLATYEIASKAPATSTLNWK